MLNVTPANQLTDGQGRPYFLWDCDLTLDQFRRILDDPDPEVRAYLVGKLMRQAKPDDVFLFVSPGAIRDLWPRLSRYLGHTRGFWTWLFETWERQGQRAEIAGASIAVDTLHEILVNKLTALLSRSELRDLLDVKVLLEAGGDLDRALADAPKKDTGFSTLTLAWVLKDFAPGPLARALGWGEAESDEMVSFQQRLVDRLVAAAAPE